MISDFAYRVYLRVAKYVSGIKGAPSEATANSCKIDFSIDGGQVALEV